MYGSGLDWTDPEDQKVGAERYSVATLSLASCRTVTGFMRTVSDLQKRGMAVAFAAGADQGGRGSGGVDDTLVVDLAVAAGVDYLLLPSPAARSHGARLDRLLDIIAATSEA